jgi:hypothetical protein
MKRPNAGFFNIYLLKSQTLIVEIFAGRMRDLQSKVAYYLLHIPTNNSWHKHTDHILLFIYLFTYLFGVYELFFIYLFPQEYL